MTWTDRHGRPEIVMHPDIKRGVASYRVVSGQATQENMNSPATELDSLGAPSSTGGGPGRLRSTRATRAS